MINAWQPSTPKFASFAIDRKKIAVLLFIAYGFISVMLPSGAVLGVNVKILLALALLVAIVFYDRNVRPMTGLLMKGMVLAVFVLAWVLLPNLAYMGKFMLGLTQAKDILVTFLLPAVLCFLVERKAMTAARFMELCCAWSVCLALLKVMIFFYSALSGIPVVQVMTTISNAFGVVMMSFDLNALGGRVQFVGDFLIPAVLYYCIAQRSKPIGISGAAVIVLLTFSVVVSFTRYLWLYSLAAFVLGCLSGGRNAYRVSMVMAMLIMVVLLVFGELILSLIELRFSTRVTSASDIERVIQINSLYRWYLDAPLFGHGLGSYTRETIRSDLLPYSYEVQLLALAAQIGLVGCLALGGTVCWFYGRAIRHARSMRRTCFVGILFAMWIGGGILNPILFSSAAAAVFAAFWAMWSLNAEARHDRRAVSGENG